MIKLKLDQKSLSIYDLQFTSDFYDQDLDVRSYSSLVISISAFLTPQITRKKNHGGLLPPVIPQYR